MAFSLRVRDNSINRTEVNSMFKNEFFPTPKLVIEQMLNYGEYSGHRDKGTVLDKNWLGQGC